MKQKESLKQIKNHCIYLDATKTKASVFLYQNFNQEIDSLEIDNIRMSENLMPSIVALCERSEIRLTDLAAIYINPGPGSYTGLRISVTTANLLAFTLDCPIFVAKTPKDIKARNINGQFSSPILPFYANPPHITTPKPRLQ